MCGSEAEGGYLPLHWPLYADLEGRFWYHDSVHFGDKPLHPLDYSFTIMLMDFAQSAYYRRIFAMPTSGGRASVIYMGRPYRTSFQERPHFRPEVFEERLRHYLEHWDEIYHRWKKEVLKIIEEIESLEFPLPPDVDAAPDGSGYPAAHKPLASWLRLLDLWLRLWWRHYEMLMLGYLVYDFFYKFCKAHFPDMPDYHVSLMLSGGRELDVSIPEKELRRLAKLAKELGVAHLLQSAQTFAEAAEALRGAGEAGRTWLAEWERAKRHFHVSAGSGMLHTDLRWDEHPDIPFTILKTYLAGGDTKKRGVDPERLVAGYASLLDEESRALFYKYLEAARRVYPYIEEHSFYVENWGFSAGYKKVREAGALLQKLGVLEDAEDVWYLNWFEVGQVMIEGLTAWASGREPTGHWRGVVECRKAAWRRWAESAPPPHLGRPPEKITDSNLAMLHRVAAASDSIAGVGASPGVAEGVVAVVREPSDFSKVRPGVVLVAPTLSPVMGPLLSVASAVVTDSGGVMSHAAILAREYGIPAVVGAGNATARLRDGMRVRVDGTRGVVEVL
ncbi:MAG: PEP-utilizing enzyme [Pyrobaculum sp.]